MSDTIYNDSYLLNISVKHIYPHIKKYLKKNQEPKGKLLDLGCGNGSILEALRDDFKDRFEYHGMDLFINQDHETENHINFLQANLNKDFNQHTNIKFDVIVSCEVIEHVIDTDHFIQNLKNLLKPGGLLILSTPNLSSFFNRLLLLFGFQPLHTEVSWKNPYTGRECLYKVIGQDHSPAAGHLRLFTYYALTEFLKQNDLKITKKTGFSSYEGLMGLISKLFVFFPSFMPGSLIFSHKKVIASSQSSS